MSTHEIIEYRGEQIDVGKIRDWCNAARNEDGTPYFTPEQTESWIQREILRRKRAIGRLTGARFEKNQGFRLGFYLKERQIFPKAFETKVEDHQAELIVRKLLRHFKRSDLARRVTVRFWGNTQSGASGGWANLRLSHNPNIGLVCHEVAHLFHHGHDRKLMQWIKRFIHYCEKKGFLKGDT